MVKRHVVSSILTVIIGFLYFYLALPAINWRSVELWSMVLLLAIAYILIFFATDIVAAKKKKSSGKTHVYGDPIHTITGIKLPKEMKIALTVIGIIAILITLVCFFTSSKVFNASAYQSMMKVEESDFATDIAQIPLSQIPVVDKSTATRLANRKIGEVVELVSQFTLSDYNTQINFNEKPFRVLPLQYADFIKWAFNAEGGIPYYVKVDMATQAAELVELEDGMKYSPSEYFTRDLMRHVRFNYPTKMINNVSFEIDDEGRPYWILPYYTYTIGIVGGKDIAGIILCDAITGNLTDYKISEVPQWIDTVYSSEIIIEQADNWGTLTNGFLNSIFSQKNVVVTTNGYNYLAIDDDVWLYTGITSVVADESNIGFLLVNLRTKQARTYPINGAEEYSAMDSAKGAVQEKNYTATFPILIYIENVPTYFISLKDNAGLVKMYSFVAVSNYQTVGVSDTLAGAMDDYLRMLKASGIIEDDTKEPEPELPNVVRIKADDIAVATVGGNTVYYIRSDNDVYTVQITVDPSLPFILEVGNEYDVEGKKASDGSITVSKITPVK